LADNAAKLKKSVHLVLLFFAYYWCFAQGMSSCMENLNNQQYQVGLVGMAGTSVFLSPLFFKLVLWLRLFNILRYGIGTTLLFVAFPQLSKSLPYLLDPCHIECALSIHFLSDIAVNCAYLMIALGILGFRFSVAARMLTTKSVSALGFILCLVSFSSGIFYGTNKSLSVEQPTNQNLYTFY
jgi:hypothetical protein